MLMKYGILLPWCRLHFKQCRREGDAYEHMRILHSAPLRGKLKGPLLARLIKTFIRKTKAAPIAIMIPACDRGFALLFADQFRLSGKHTYTSMSEKE